MFCPKCGADIKDIGQKFCESCGADLPKKQIEEKPKKVESKEVEHKKEKQEKTKAKKEIHFLPYNRPGGVFDPKRDYYILKEGYWDWGSGDILDEKNQVIGKMHRKILSIRRKVELLEVDGTISASIHAKLVSARQAQDLKDPEGNLIARIKKKILSFFRPKFFLEGADGVRYYEAQGKLMGWSYKVTDLSTMEIVAEIEKADRWRDVFLGGLFDYKDTYALRILDPAVDRRILVGFVLSIDNILHDN